MIGITRVKLDQQTSQSTTTTKPDGTQQTVISQGPAQDATLSATSGNARNPAENSLGLASDGGLATGDLVVYQSQGTAIAGLVDGQRTTSSMCPRTAATAISWPPRCRTPRTALPSSWARPAARAASRCARWSTSSTAAAA